MASFIPTATEINYDFDKILKKLDITLVKLDQLNPYIQTVNNENLRNIVREMNDNLVKIKKYNKNMENMTTSINHFNDLLKPISSIAKNKLIATEIEANTKEKSRINNEKMDYAKIRSNDENIPLWKAIKLNEEDNKDNKYLTFSGIFITGLILGFTGKEMYSKL
jgi:hypothetical protein